MRGDPREEGGTREHETEAAANTMRAEGPATQQTQQTLDLILMPSEARVLLVSQHTLSQPCLIFSLQSI